MCLLAALRDKIRMNVEDALELARYREKEAEKAKKEATENEKKEILRLLAEQRQTMVAETVGKMHKLLRMAGLEAKDEGQKRKRKKRSSLKKKGKKKMKEVVSSSSSSDNGSEESDSSSSRSKDSSNDSSSEEERERKKKPRRKQKTTEAAQKKDFEKKKKRGAKNKEERCEGRKALPKEGSSTTQRKRGRPRKHPMNE